MYNSFLKGEIVMKNELEIALAIQNGDINRRSFFISKLKSDLKRFALSATDEELEELFDAAVEQFIDKNLKTGFYFSCLGFVRKKLEKEDSNTYTYVPNKFFLRSEFVIIQKYLDTQHGFITIEEIANELGISILDVSNTIYKLKNTLATNRREVLALFPTALKVISDREQLNNTTIRRKKKNINTPSIDEHSLELLGYYTGQIDDICLSIDELAKKYYTSCRSIEEQLKAIITSCKDPKLYNKVLEKYPSIEELLAIKAKALGVSFRRRIHTTEQKEIPRKIVEEKKPDCEKLSVFDQRNLQFLQMLYQRKPDGTFLSEKEIAKELGLDFRAFKRKKDYLYRKLENKEYSDKILSYYPNLFIDKKAFEEGVHTNSKTVEAYLSFLSTIYQLKGDGSFYPVSDSLKQLRIQRKTYDKRKEEIYQAFENNDKIKQVILEKIPDFLEKRKNYEQFLSSVATVEEKDSVAISKKAYTYAEFFKALYTKNEDGIYPSIRQLAEQFHITKQNVSVRKVKFLENMEKREKLKKEVLELYPTLYEDKKIYDTYRETPSKDDKDFSLDVDWAVEFCQYLYKTQVQGKFLSYSSLAHQKQMTPMTFIRKKDTILHTLETDEVFRTEFSNKYPDFFQDKLLYEEAQARGECFRQRKKENFSIEYYVKLLRAYYEEKKNGTYATMVSLEDSFHTNKANLTNRKKRILDLVACNTELKQKVLALYPTLYEDMAIRKAVKSHKKGTKNTINVELGKKIAQGYVNFLKGIYQENDEHISFEVTAEKLGYTQAELLGKIRRISEMVKNEKNVRKYFNLFYPNLADDMKKYDAAEKLIKDKKMASEKAEIYSKLLKELYHRKSNGSYSSANVYSYLRQLNMPNLRSAKYFVLQEIEHNSFLLDEILQLYPTFLEDKKAYDEAISKIEQRKNESSHSITKKEPKEKVMRAVDYQEKLNFLKLYYQKNEEGNYYSMQEMAELLEIQYASVCNKRIHIEKLLSEDEAFKAFVLKDYPTVFEDIDVRDKIIQAKKYADFLRAIYQKKEDGTYRSINEVIETLSISPSNFYILKNKVFDLLDSSEDTKNRILVEYPTLMEDRKAFQISQSELTENERKVADTFLVDRTREIITYTSLAKNLQVSSQFVKVLEDKALIKIKNYPPLQKDYPTAMIEANIRRNSSKKNTVSVSLEELGRISDIHTDLNKEKTALFEGIKLLEYSSYQDFVQLCTPKQKAMLALRLGFFNHTIFGSQDIADMFDVTQEEVTSLTEECIKVCCSDDSKISQKKKRY